METTISRILVPLDFSVHSDRALAYATMLAQRLEASLRLLNVVEPLNAAALAGEGYLITVPELTDSMVKEARRRMADYRDIAPPGLVIETDVAVGPAATTIAETAREQQCDLIVMGTHGRTGLAHLFMGSVAERVTRLAPCPVLTVRPIAGAASPAAPLRTAAGAHT